MSSRRRPIAIFVRNFRGFRQCNRPIDAFYVLSQRIDLIAKPRRLSQSVYKSPFYGVARGAAEAFDHRGKGLYVAWFSALHFLILCLGYSARVESTRRSIKRQESGIIVTLFHSSVQNFKLIGETNKFSGHRVLFCAFSCSQISYKRIILPSST